MHLQKPSANILGNPVGSGNPDADDQEVTFPRGRGLVPLGQPFQPPAPMQPDGGWAPQEPPPQPPTPAQLKCGCGVLDKHINICIALGDPEN